MKWFLKVFSYTHRLIPWLIISEASSGRRWEQTHSKALCRKIIYKLKVLIRSLPLEIWEPCRRGGEKIVVLRGDRGHQENMVCQSTNQCSHGLKVTEAACKHRTCTRPPPLSLYIYIRLIAWWFCETPVSGSGYTSDSFAFSWHSLAPIGLPCPAVIWGFCLSYCILFCPAWLLSLGSLVFSEEKMEWEWILGQGQVVVLGRVKSKVMLKIELPLLYLVCPC